MHARTWFFFMYMLTQCYCVSIQPYKRESYSLYEYSSLFYRVEYMRMSYFVSVQPCSLVTEKNNKKRKNIFRVNIPSEKSTVVRLSMLLL
jgi:hypothetical protein